MKNKKTYLLLLLGCLFSNASMAKSAVMNVTLLNVAQNPITIEYKKCVSKNWDEECESEIKNITIDKAGSGKNFTSILLPYENSGDESYPLIRIIRAEEKNNGVMVAKAEYYDETNSKNYQSLCSSKIYDGRGWPIHTIIFDDVNGSPFIMCNPKDGVTLPVVG